MASKLVDTKIVPGHGVTFVIEHLPTDSYSRSVRPAARRAYREQFHLMRMAGIPAGAPSVWEDRWEHDLPAPGEKSRTAITFTFVKPEWADA